MGDTVEYGHAARRGFRAVALAAVLALLMAFGWSARQAMDGFDLGFSGNAPALAELSDGIGADGLGSLLHAVKPPLDQFKLPRPVMVETSRTALSGPPKPEPDKLLPAMVAAAPSWARPATSSLQPLRPLPEAIGWGSPRTPTGPPAA